MNIGDTIDISAKGDTAKIIGEGFINKTSTRFFNVITEKGTKYRINKDVAEKFNKSEKAVKKDEYILDKKKNGEIEVRKCK